MDDREIARRALDLEHRGRNYAVINLPGYADWSKQKLADGESAALIANLDSLDMWLLPEDVERITNDDFDELLEDLKYQLALSNESDSNEAE